MNSIISTALAGVFLLSGTGSSSILNKSAPPAPEPVPETYVVRMTGYNAVPGQTDSDPDVTASGAYSDTDIVAARSVDLAEELPFGTVIEISRSATSTDPNCGYALVDHLVGYRVIADSMHPRKRNQIDVLFHVDSSVRAGGVYHNAATVLGMCKDIDIEVVGKVAINKMPRSQTELAQMIGRASLAAK